MSVLSVCVSHGSVGSSTAERTYKFGWQSSITWAVIVKARNGVLARRREVLCLNVEQTAYAQTFETICVHSRGRAKLRRSLSQPPVFTPASFVSALSRTGEFIILSKQQILRLYFYFFTTIKQQSKQN